MSEITCKNCNKEFDGIMASCGTNTTYTIYRCPHCQHLETTQNNIDWSKATIAVSNLRKTQEK